MISRSDRESFHLLLADQPLLCPIEMILLSFGRLN
jgi:hypothetical protein